MTLKAILSTAILYGILIALQGTTGFAGIVWNVAYYFAVVTLWVALIAFTLIIVGITQPKMQKNFRRAAPKVKPVGICVGTALGTIVALIWMLVLHSPWVAAGQTIFVIMSLFLKLYSLNKLRPVNNGTV